MYALLSGCLPFYGQTPKDVFEKIKGGFVNFDLKEFRTVTDSAKDLILSLICVDKNKRLTCS